MSVPFFFLLLLQKKKSSNFGCNNEKKLHNPGGMVLKGISSEAVLIVCLRFSWRNYWRMQLEIWKALTLQIVLKLLSWSSKDGFRAVGVPHTFRIASRPDDSDISSGIMLTQCRVNPTIPSIINFKKKMQHQHPLCFSCSANITICFPI